MSHVTNVHVNSGNIDSACSNMIKTNSKKIEKKHYIHLKRQRGTNDFLCRVTFKANAQTSSNLTQQLGLNEILSSVRKLIDKLA